MLQSARMWVLLAANLWLLVACVAMHLVVLVPRTSAARVVVNCDAAANLQHSIYNLSTNDTEIYVEACPLSPWLHAIVLCPTSALPPLTLRNVTIVATAGRCVFLDCQWTTFAQLNLSVVGCSVNASGGSSPQHPPALVAVGALLRQSSVSIRSIYVVPGSNFSTALVVVGTAMEHATFALADVTGAIVASCVLIVAVSPYTYGSASTTSALSNTSITIANVELLVAFAVIYCRAMIVEDASIRVTGTALQPAQCVAWACHDRAGLVHLHGHTMHRVAVAVAGFTSTVGASLGEMQFALVMMEVTTTPSDFRLEVVRREWANITVTVDHCNISARGSSLVTGVFRCSAGNAVLDGDVPVLVDAALRVRQSQFQLAAEDSSVLTWRDAHLVSVVRVTLEDTVVSVADTHVSVSMTSGASDAQTASSTSSSPTVVSAGVLTVKSCSRCALTVSNCDVRVRISNGTMAFVSPNTGLINAWTFGFIMAVMGNVTNSALTIDASSIATTIVVELARGVINAVCAVGTAAFYVSGTVRGSSMRIVDSAVVLSNASTHGVMSDSGGAFALRLGVNVTSVLLSYADNEQSATGTTKTSYLNCSIVVVNITMWHPFVAEDMCLAKAQLLAASGGMRKSSNQLVVLSLPSLVESSDIVVEGLRFQDLSTAANPPPQGACPMFSLLGSVDPTMVLDTNVTVTGTIAGAGSSADTPTTVALTWLFLFLDTLDFQRSTLSISDVTFRAVRGADARAACAPTGFMAMPMSAPVSTLQMQAGTLLLLSNTTWVGCNTVLPTSASTFIHPTDPGSLAVVLSCSNAMCSAADSNVEAAGCDAARMRAACPHSTLISPSTYGLPVAEWITVRFATHSCPAALQKSALASWLGVPTASQTIVPPPAPPPSVPWSDALPVVERSAGAATVAVGAVGAVLATSGVYHAQRALLSLKLMHCAGAAPSTTDDGSDALEDDAPEPLSVADSPTQWQLGSGPLSSNRGAALGNVLVAVAVVVLLWGSGVVVELGRGGRWSAPPTRNAVMVLAAASWGSAGLPGTGLVPYSTLLQPTVAASLELLLSATAADVVLGAVVLSCCSAPIPFLLWRLTPPPRFGRCAPRGSIFPPTSNEGSRAARGLVSGLRWLTHRAWLWEIAGDGAAPASRRGALVDASMRQGRATLQHYGAVFSEYRGPTHAQRHFYVAELLIAYVSGVAAGVVSEVSPDAARCATLTWVVVAASALFLGAGLWLRPYSSRLMNLNLLVNGVLAIVGLICVLAGSETGTNTVAVLQVALVGVVAIVDVHHSVYVLCRRLRVALPTGSWWVRLSPTARSPRDAGVEAWRQRMAEIGTCVPKRGRVPREVVRNEPDRPIVHVAACDDQHGEHPPVYQQHCRLAVLVQTICRANARVQPVTHEQPKALSSKSPSRRSR